MGRNAKSGVFHAGVSLIALAASLGPAPAFADDYIINADVSSVLISNGIDGSVINNATVGDGTNDFGVLVATGGAVSGDLINNGVVSADITDEDIVSNAEAAGIAVVNGGQVEGQIINNGTVDASAGATGVQAFVTGFGIFSQDDESPGVQNSSGADISIETSANAAYSAQAISGGIGVQVGGGVGGAGTGSGSSMSTIANEGSVASSSSAEAIGVEGGSPSSQAIASAFGVGQSVVDQQAQGSLTNATDGVIAVSAQADTEYYGGGLALAAGGGVLQLVAGDEASSTLSNQGDVAVSASADASGKSDDPGEGAIAAAIGAGGLQLAVGETSAEAEITNDGAIAAEADASADGLSAIAVGAGLGNAQAAIALDGAGTTFAQLTNTGIIASNNSAEAAGDMLAVAAAVGAGNIQIAAGGGDALAQTANTGEIDAANDSSASGEAGIAISAGLGNVQAALGLGLDSTAMAGFANDGSISANSGADAQGVMYALAGAGSFGSVQIAVAGTDSSAAMANSGAINADVESTAESSDGESMAVSAGLAITQASLSLAGVATADLSNSGDAAAEAHASSEGMDATGNSVASAVTQVSGSYAGEADASLNNAESGHINAAATVDSTGTAYARPDAYTIGAGQIAVSGMADATASLNNAGEISATGAASGSSDAATGFVEAEADVAAIDQLAASQSGTAVMSVTNTSTIDASATVTGTAAGVDAAARVQGVNQYGLAYDVSQTVDNSGSISVNSGASANGAIGSAFAAGYGVVQAAIPGNGAVALHNTGDINVRSEAHASDSAVAGAVGQFVNQPLGLVPPIPLPVGAAASLPGAVNPGALIGELLPVDLPVDLMSVVGGLDLPSIGLVDPQLSYTTLQLDVANAQGARIEVDAHASGANSSTAAAAGGWYEAKLGQITGTIGNDGVIMASAYASGNVSTAIASGVTEVSALSNATTITNSGVISAYAAGTNASAAGVNIGKFALLQPAMAPEPSDAVTAINNEGGAISGAVSDDDGATIHRGLAVNTRGGFYTYDSGQAGEAFNAVEINLRGGAEGSLGAYYATTNGLLSSAMRNALRNETSWGYVYGNIEITTDDTVNVTDGVTVLDGVVNYTGEEGVGTVNVTGGGELALLRNETDGASGIRAAEFNMDSSGTLAYELSADTQPGSYGQVSASAANVDGGHVAAIYDNSLYADSTVYDNVISADTLTGTVTAQDNSALLVTTAVNDGENNIDLQVDRVAFDDVSGLSGNRKNVASAIESVYGKIDGASAFGQLVGSMFTLDGSQYKDALAQLSGAEYAQQLQSVLWSTRAVNRIVSERMECSDGATYVKTSNAAKLGDASVVPVADVPSGTAGCFLPGTGSVWARGYGQWNSLDGDSNAPGYQEDQYGFLFGADYAFNENLFLGVAGGYFNSNDNFDSWGGRSGSSMSYDGLQLAAYGGYDNSVYYLRGVTSYGNYQGDGKRSLDLPTAAPVALSGDPSSDTWSFYGETGYRFSVGESGSVTPFAGLSIATASLNGFTEDASGGDGAALRVHDSNANSLASVLGGRFEADVPVGSGVFTPTVSVSWMHEFDSTAQDVSMSFADAPSGGNFTAKGSEVARDSVLLDAGAKFALTSSADIGLYYNGQFNADYTSNAVTARIGYRF